MVTLPAYPSGVLKWQLGDEIVGGTDMQGHNDVSKHYTHGNLIDAIRTALGTLGKSVDTVTVDDLAPVDEFSYRWT